MPPRGYRHLSVREEVYKRLEEFARSKGLAYPADAITILLEYADIYSKLEHLLQVRVKDLLQTGVTLPRTGVTTNSTSKVETTTSTGNPSAQSKAKVEEKRRIIVFTLEWARQKGINTEEYMAKKEKEGYICNETSKKVYCIWREDIEQLVVDLNSSNARMGELENVLSGERLDIARKAIEAGLLWYDSRERRWKAPL
jgi:hypothetical protein